MMYKAILWSAKFVKDCRFVYTDHLHVSLELEVYSGEKRHR